MIHEGLKPLFMKMSIARISGIEKTLNHGIKDVLDWKWYPKVGEKTRIATSRVLLEV